MGNIRIKDIATAASSSASDDYLAIDGATNGTRKLSAYSPSFGGTLFLGTSTDSSNGKLQLATHTTSAGGIGFGTDLSLWRRTANAIRLGPSSGGKTVEFEIYNGSGNALKLTYNYPSSPELFSDDALLIRSLNGAITLKSANVTALTLDSSQNATFAGQIGASNTIYTSKAFLALGAATNFNASSTQLEQLNANTGRLFTRGPDSSTNGALTFTSTRSNGGNSIDLLAFSAAGNATFAGSVAINNTVQAAVAVASTHKVTISIGGVTYYLLASNV